MILVMDIVKRKYFYDIIKYRGRIKCMNNKINFNDYELNISVFEEVLIWIKNLGGKNNE